MFIKEATDEEILLSTEKKLEEAQNNKPSIRQYNLTEASKLLDEASELLKQAKMDDEADVAGTLSKEVKTDTDDLTSEKMVINLKTKGWVFNPEDAGDAEDFDFSDDGEGDDVDSKSKEKLEMGVDDYANLEPQLNQEELKNLRFVNKKLAQNKNSLTRDELDLLHHSLTLYFDSLPKDDMNPDSLKMYEDLLGKLSSMSEKGPADVKDNEVKDPKELLPNEVPEMDGPIWPENNDEDEPWGWDDPNSPLPEEGWKRR